MTTDIAPRPPFIRDFRPFLICSEGNYQTCREFYLDLGFEILWEGGPIAEFATGFGDQRFLLSLHHGLESTGHGMLHFWVDDVDAWYAHVQSLGLADKYPQCRIAEPSVAEWGWRILYIWDPAGLLLHIAEPHAPENKAFFGAAPWIRRDEEES